MDPKLPLAGEVPAGGDQESPATDIPLHREVLLCNETLPNSADLVQALEMGKLLVARERYGIVCGWKKTEGQFRGVLLQHKSVMEDKTFDTADDLRTWYISTVLAVE